MKKWIDNYLWYNRGYRHDKPKHFWYFGVFPSTVIFLLTWFHFFSEENLRFIFTQLCVIGMSIIAGFAKEILDWWQGKEINFNKSFKIFKKEFKINIYLSIN